MRRAALIETVYRDLRGIETTPRTDRAHLDATIEWLYRSQDATGTGGSAATYNLVLGWEAPYPETTGYIVPTLYDYAEHTSEPEPRRRAERMARWLLDVQLDSGAFPAGTVDGDDPEPSVFNTGQILFGLRRAYAETGSGAFLTALREASEWLVTVQEDDGYWSDYAYKDTVHVYTARVGWAMAAAAEVTDNETVTAAARRNLMWAASLQRENGTFRRCAFEPGAQPVLHTIAYTIRGLVEGGAVLDESSLVDAGRRAADRLLERQLAEGELSGAYDEHWTGADFACLTGNAQMAIAWYRLAELTGDDSYLNAARTAVQALKRAQFIDGPDPVRGGLAGSRPVWGRYMWLRYPNWAPKFFADALQAALAAGRGDSKSTATPTRQEQRQRQ